MTINIRDTLLLDDNNEYIVVSKANYDNRNYYCLQNEKNVSDRKICYEDNGELVEVNNKDLITKLLPLFFNETWKVIDN